MEKEKTTPAAAAQAVPPTAAPTPAAVAPGQGQEGEKKKNFLIELVRMIIAMIMKWLRVAGEKIGLLKPEGQEGKEGEKQGQKSEGQKQAQAQTQAPAQAQAQTQRHGFCLFGMGAGGYDEPQPVAPAPVTVKETPKPPTATENLEMAMQKAGPTIQQKAEKLPVMPMHNGAGEGITEITAEIRAEKPHVKQSATDAAAALAAHVRQGQKQEQQTQEAKDDVPPWLEVEESDINEYLASVSAEPPAEFFGPAPAQAEPAKQTQTRRGIRH